MQPLRRFAFPTVLLLAFLGGCDGRGGSSGFDVTAENAAIRMALMAQECVDFDGLTICPANVPGIPTPSATPATPTSISSGTPTGTPASAPSVQLLLGNASTIDCVEYAPGSCTFTLTFTPQGFAPGTAFRVLSRSGVPDSLWALAADPVPSGASGESSFDVTLVLTGPPAQIQFAVLAFTTPPPSAPMEFQQLLHTGAAFAFVTDLLSVNALPVCCQCPDFCSVPAGGTCGGCTVVVGASCSGGSCTALTPTPTTTPTQTVAPTITPERPSCLSDNGDGTVSDACTGLMWEKKDLAQGLHDAYALYTWAGTCSNGTSPFCQPDAGAAALCADATNGALGCAECPNGGTCNVDLSGPSPRGAAANTTIWGWLEQLNAGEGFAGHNDWRIPMVDRDGGLPELDTIGQTSTLPVFDTDCPAPPPCNDFGKCNATGLTCVLFSPLTPGLGFCRALPGCTVTSCSCTRLLAYWSATSDLSTPNLPPGYAWYVDFSDRGLVLPSGKQVSYAVRAVRGGAVTPKPTRTPTPTSTPAASDCCQCPSSCAAPVAGDCGGCAVVFGAGCEDGLLCAPAAPTPTPTHCALTDNGDGTITDACTRLMWEKKDHAGGVHDATTAYAWAGLCADDATRCQPNAAAAAACAAQTGGADGCGQCARGLCDVNSPMGVDGTNSSAATTIWEWLTQLNAAQFAGHSDWRIPSVGEDGDVAELETLLAAPYPCVSSPCVPPAFATNCTPACDLSSCSCTQPAPYWSASGAVVWADLLGVLVPLPGAEWTVSFGNPGGLITYSDASAHHYIRAVRGGP